MRLHVVPSLPVSWSDDEVQKHLKKLREGRWREWTMTDTLLACLWFWAVLWVAIS